MISQNNHHSSVGVARKILVTTARWKTSLTIMRSLGRKGHQMSVIGGEPYLTAFFSKFCSERVLLAGEDDPETYLQTLLGHLERNRYDFLIPVSDFCNDLISRNRKKIQKYVRVSLPTAEHIQLANKKVETYRFAQQNNIRIPRTFFAVDEADISKVADQLSYPCVIKASEGSGASGVKYAHSRGELIEHYQQEHAREEWPIIQEFIKGRFLAFTAVCREGELLDYFMAQVLRQCPLNGGISARAVSILEEGLRDFSKNLIKKIGWTGAIDLDIFQTEDGSYILLEINPRLSGMTQFAYECGADLPLRYLDLLEGREGPVVQGNYKGGILYRAIFSEEIRTCLENKKFIPGFFLSFLRPGTKYDFYLDDPKLLLRQIKMTKWELWG